MKNVTQMVTSAFKTITKEFEIIKGKRHDQEKHISQVEVDLQFNRDRLKQLEKQVTEQMEKFANVQLQGSLNDMIVKLETTVSRLEKVGKRKLEFILKIHFFLYRTLRPRNQPA